MSANKLNARATAAPAAEPSQPTKRRTEIVIVGAGDETLIDVGPILGDQYRTYSVDSASEIADLAATSWIGLYDATTQAAGRSAFAQLESQYANHPWIVLCSDEDKPNWRDVLARGGACAVIARGELSAANFTAAITKAIQRQTTVASAQPATTGFNPRAPLTWIIAGAVVAALSGTAWWLSHSHSGTPAATPAASHKLVISGASATAQAPAAAAHATAAPAPSVEDLLSLARVAFRDPNAQLPRADAPLQGTSALELYGAVLLQQPKNDEALDGVRRLQAVARLRVQNDLANGDADTAGRLLAILQRAAFNPQELRSLEAAVAAAKPKQLAAQTRGAIAGGNLQAAHQYVEQLVALIGERAPVPELRKEIDARKLDLELTAAAEQVHAAITAGTLLEPEADNARTRLLAMRELGRSAPQTVAAQHDLLQALLRRVQNQINQKDFDRAAQTLTAAQDFGSKADLADSRNALESAVAAKRAADAAVVAAAAARASAPAAAPAAALVVLSPRPTKPLEVEFPSAAEAQGVQGYAVVEFMLNPNGSASGATVVESAPHGTFDSAALSAVKHAMFSTKNLADPKKAQRARFKINFTLADGTKPAPAPLFSKAAPAAAPAAPPVAPPGAPPAAPANGPVEPPQVLSPKPTHPLEVEYPKLALELNRTGYVVVEFMLNPDGTAGSPTVVESMPAKTFDNAALTAVKRARFVTQDLADPTKPQRARVKINFKGS